MVKVIDLAHITYQVTDLVLMERFLRDFGLVKLEESTTERLYMRGRGHQAYLHRTLHGNQNRFIGASFEVASKEALTQLASFPDASDVEALTTPGGGFRVVMIMPDGFEIEAIWGREKAEVIPFRGPNAFNSHSKKERLNLSLRETTGPAEVIRLGHFVLHVTDHDQSVKWLSERFDLVASDHFVPTGTDGPIIGSFLRFDHGEEMVDHHTVLILQSDQVGVHHCAFEVQDLDSIMTSHDYLVAKNWHLDFGVGRHYLGSQLFDYWKDPFGFRIEHYTDSDMVNNKFKPEKFNGTASDTTLWGMRPPLDFFD